MRAEELEIMVAGALRKQYLHGARVFLADMARLLETALPGAVRVKRHGRRGGDNRPIQCIEVDVPGVDGGDTVHYAIEHAGRGPLAASRTPLVPGAVTRSEAISVEAWIRAVGAAVSAQARQSETARDALRRFLA